MTQTNTPEDALLNAFSETERENLHIRRAVLQRKSHRFLQQHPVATGASLGGATVLAVLSRADHRARKARRGAASTSAKPSRVRAATSFLSGLLLRTGIRSITSSLAVGDVTTTSRTPLDD